MSISDPSGMEQGGEALPHVMLGDDGLSQEERLAKYTGDVDWSYLAPHQRAGSLYYVDPAQDLTVVAKAFIDDDAEAVGALKKAGDLVLMDHLHAEWFEKNPQKFIAAVVAPFVLCQPLSE